MSCPTPNCRPAASAGAGLDVVTVPQRACSGQTFCDPRLAGLPFVNGFDLVGVAEGAECLSRLVARKGFWLHDPNRPGGADYIGDLDELRFVPASRVSDSECGYIPLMRTVDPDLGTVEFVPQSVRTLDSGNLAILTQCSGGKSRFDVLEPVPWDASNACRPNFSLLGYELQTVLVDGVATQRKVWRPLQQFIWPDTQMTQYDSFDPAVSTERRLVAKKEGNCWKFGLAPVEEPDANCLTYESVGTSFGFLLACDGGVTKKVEPTEGKTLVGRGGAWVAGSPMVFTDVTALSVGGAGKPTVFTTAFALPADIPEGVTAILLDAELLIIKDSGSGALFKVSVNGWPLIGGFGSGSFISPYDTNQKFIEYPTSRTLTFASSLSYDIPGTWDSWSLIVKIRGYIP